jgi:ubiquinol-cytochrome c reductase cytochrome b/c1 subunit
MVLHERGRTSPLYLLSREEKIHFHKRFIIKDAINLVLFGGFFLFVLFSPYILGDAENFIEANPLASPLHIKPE